MSTPTVKTLSAEIEAMRAEIVELRKQLDELKAARPAVAARPVVAKKVEGDPKGRTPPIFARDAAYALQNVLGTKCWVQPINGKFRVTKGPDPLPADEMTGAELLAFVGKIRAEAMPTAKPKAETLETLPWSESEAA